MNFEKKWRARVVFQDVLILPGSLRAEFRVAGRISRCGQGFALRVRFRVTRNVSQTFYRKLFFRRRRRRTPNLLPWALCGIFSFAGECLRVPKAAVVPSSASSSKITQNPLFNPLKIQRQTRNIGASISG